MLRFIKKRLFLLLFFYALYANTYSQDTSILSYNLGDTSVNMRKFCFKSCTSKVIFLNLHGDEQTSVKAAEEYVIDNGGTLVSINNNQRIVDVNLSGRKYSFDPNRIFSIAGTEATVKLYSKTFDTSAGNRISTFANQLLSGFIDSTNLIVTLHNNKDSGLSVLSYQKDQRLKKHSGKVFVNKEMDPDDFMLTTDTSIFRRIKEKNINVIYEKADLTKDDGSLSIHSGRLNIPYINVESQHGHFIEQFAMLLAIDDIIKDYEKSEATDEIASK